YIVLMKKKITIKMPDSVPPAVSNAFTGIIPATAGIFTVGIIEYLFSLNQTTVIDFISKTIQEPLMNISQGYGSVLLVTFLVQLFWFFGIHGTNVLAPITESIWTTALIANMNAAKVQKPLPYMWTRADFDFYVWIGGAGSTLLLLIAILIFSKREDQRAVAKVSLVPGFFNINEPAMFGLPIVLDPIYFIPFILAPLVMVSVAYGALSMGWVNPVRSQITWAMPPFINAFLGTIDWRAVVLQVVNMIIGFLIYVPFVKIANNVKPDEVA
ncbi:PTS sugar transporter subunit IIC, partial [Lactobacillus sp. XV13L]|nr:PTS sugar transporter subunit IIC [Lactobacillus sp. XV13L]